MDDNFQRNQFVNELKVYALDNSNMLNRNLKFTRKLL